MIRDNNVLFSDSQAITASGATASTNYVDQVAVGDAQGGKDLVIVASIPAAFTGSLTTVTFAIESADDSAFSTNLTTNFSSGAIAKASLVVGATPVRVAWPKGMRRYVRLKYTLDAAASTGKIDAFAVLNPDIPATHNP